MSKRIIVDRADMLDSITDAVHDCWFDLDSVKLTGGVLEIPFQRKSLTVGMLRIHEVESVEIEDTERVGKYDFNRVHFDSSTRQVTITTGIPLEFRVRVRRLEISCEEAGAIGA